MKSAGIVTCEGREQWQGLLSQHPRSQLVPSVHQIEIEPL